MDTGSEYIDQLLIVIVLYKTTLPESKSYQSLRAGLRSYAVGNQRIDLMVMNNGPSGLNCQADEDIFRLHLTQQLDNPGVSKAYNLAGQLASRLQKRWLFLLDQDTRLPPDFWNQYAQSINNHPDLPLHAPKLRAGNVLASPCGYRFYRGYVLPNIDTGVYPMKGRNVLNSGLLVRVDAFDQVGGYDESVRLYFSDFVFFDRLKTVYDAFAVVNVDLLHDLSSSDYSSRAIAMDRFLLYCQGAHAAAKGNLSRSFLYFLTVGARSLVMGRRFNTLAFTQMFIRTWF